MCPGLEVCQDFALTCPWCLVWFLRDPGQQGNPCWALSVLALARRWQGATCGQRTHPPPSLPQHGFTLLLSTPPAAGGGPRPPLLLGLRASKVTICSCPPSPSPLSYQLKHFRVQAKKPKSTLKKSLKGQNTNTGEGVWSGVERRLGKGELLASFNRLQRTPMTLWAPRCMFEDSHCFQ